MTTTTEDIATMLQKMATDLVEAQELKEKVEYLEDVEQAAMYACTRYLFREEHPEMFEEAMRRLYRTTRRDLWEEEKRKES